MPAVLLARGLKGGKGTWEFYHWAGRRTVMVTCPVCGSIGSLSDHEIGADGGVTPSVQCPDCFFHEWVVLDGYDEDVE